jgi:hypothetical protein
MLKKSDLIYLTIVFFLMRHFKLFNKINTFKKTKDISYSVGIKFSALMIITYVFKTVVIYLLKTLNLINFLPNILKNDIIEGHESGCVIVYGEPGEPLNTWQVATINETENVNLNHCYFNVETNSWDSNPNNVTTTDTTNCMCQPGTHRHQVDDPLGPGTAERPIIDIGLGQATVPEDPGSTGPEPAVGEPFVVMPPDELLQNVGDTVSCDETCGYHGLTCVNSIGTENRFQGNTDRNSDGYANELANYITNIPEQYRNTIIHESLSNPNQTYWINSNGAPGNRGQNEISKRLPADDPNGMIGLGDMINDRDAVGSLTCDGGDRSRGQVSSFASGTLVRTIPCFCQQPGGSAVPPTCVPPADITSFNIQDPPSDADLTIDNFDVTLQCADGFTGTATATACSADGEEYTITSDCAEGEAGMVLTEPFLVFMSDSEIDAGTPGSGVYCADICSNRGLTCTNSVGPQNSFQSNNAVGSTGYNNDFRDYLLSVPEEYRNNRLHNALQNPNTGLNYQAFRTGYQQVEINQTNNTLYFGEFLNERDDMTCHPMMSGSYRTSIHHQTPNRWAHAFCSCQQP